jgi:hypothetical protein
LQVRIPDDRTSRSQFAIIDDELEEQLREILEANHTADDSMVFKQARDQYMACMDLDKLEEFGLQPVKDLLEKFGGWPVLDKNWNEAEFKWLVCSRVDTRPFNFVLIKIVKLFQGGADLQISRQWLQHRLLV